MAAYDVPSIVSAIANSIMAVGVLIAAKGIIIQKRVHIIDIHNKFQNKFRSIQEKMPPDINDRNILTISEKRIIRLYWYALFDVWFTCKHSTGDKDLNQIWLDFAWGGKSGIDRIPCFSVDYIDFREIRPYLFGTRNMFFDDFEKFINSYGFNNIKRNFVLFYGVPCSGKSSIISMIGSEKIGIINIDSVIKSYHSNPNYSDFSSCAESICLDIYKLCLKMDDKDHILIEVGCLFPKKWGIYLSEMLRLLGVNVVVIKIDINIKTAKERASYRNEKIRNGLSDALPIDDLDKMDFFFDKLKENIIECNYIIDASREIKFCADELQNCII